MDKRGLPLLHFDFSCQLLVCFPSTILWVKVFVGSHNDLGVMATKAKEAATDPNQIKSHPVGPSHTTESVPSRDTLKKASPQVQISNIDIKPKTEIPHIKLVSDGQAGQETTQNTWERLVPSS